MNNSSRAPEASYQKLSNRAFLLIAACGIVTWFFFAHQDHGVEGFLAGLSVCAVLGVGAILGRYRNRLSFWTTLAFIGLVHGLLVVLIHWPQQFHGPGIMLAPLVIGDMYVSARLVIFVVKHTGG